MRIEKKDHYKVKPFGLAQGCVKDVDEVGRTVTGFFNSFNFFDHDHDVVIPGAAKASIRERGPKSNAVSKIKHAMFHDLTRLPGKIMVLEERKIDAIHGIYFETKMAETNEGNDALKNYAAGIYDNHSIGFQYLDMEFIEREAKGWDKIMNQISNPEDMKDASIVFVIKELKLFEGSTVAFGANALTPYLGTKADGSMTPELRRAGLMDRLTKLSTMQGQLNKALKDGTQTDEAMETFELQVLQIKQMIDELMRDASFDIVDPKLKAIEATKQKTAEIKGLSLPSFGGAFKF